MYGITFEADNGVGGVCTGTVTVCVPHDRRGDADDCVGDGQDHNSLVGRVRLDAPFLVRKAPRVGVTSRRDPSKVHAHASAGIDGASTYYVLRR